MMLGRLINPVLWEYGAETPTDKLLRHHRIARFIVYTWATSSVLMVSSLVEFMFSGGWLRNVALVVFPVSAGVALLSFIPGIVCLAWSSEIEKALTKRRVPLPTGRPVGDRIRGMVLKMGFWFMVLVLGVHFSH